MLISATRNELNKILKILHLLTALNSHNVLVWVTLPLLSQLFHYSEILTRYCIAGKETVFCFTELQQTLKVLKLEKTQTVWLQIYVLEKYFYICECRISHWSLKVFRELETLWWFQAKHGCSWNISPVQNKQIE